MCNDLSDILNKYLNINDIRYNQSIMIEQATDFNNFSASFNLDLRHIFICINEKSGHAA